MPDNTLVDRSGSFSQPPARSIAADQPMAKPNFDVVMHLPVQVRIVLGSVTMPVSALAQLGRGSVVALDRKVGEPVDVMVNGRLVARGDVVVLEDDNARFGISLTEIVEAGAPALSTRPGSGG
jgi:flagellar motor switch protein FliN